METQRVQFLEANGEWVTAVISDDSRVAHALLGAKGEVYDKLRTLYRYKPEDPLTPEEIKDLKTDLEDHKTCIKFLLSALDLWNSEGSFMFPNGLKFTKE